MKKEIKSKKKVMFCPQCKGRILIVGRWGVCSPCFIKVDRFPLRLKSYEKRN